MVRFVTNVLRHTDYIVEEMLGIKSRIVPILQLVHNLISFDAVERQVEELHVLKSAISLRLSAAFGIIQASLASALTCTKVASKTFFCVSPPGGAKGLLFLMCVQR